MGNSEVGHMTIGAGQVIAQSLPRINQAIRDNSLARNPRLREHIAALQKTAGTCHILGLVSPGGVHCHQDHIAQLAKFVAQAGIAVRIHGFLDGRDCQPGSAPAYLQKLATACRHSGDIQIASLCGRYYAMDRDQRYARTRKAFRLLLQEDSAIAIVKNWQAAFSPDYQPDYQTAPNDEFFPPTMIAPGCFLKDGDGLLAANFRADRMRQLLEALLVPDFDGFPRPCLPHFAHVLGMVEYSADLNRWAEALFPPPKITGTIGEKLAAAQKRQLRIAETEKYPHVTYFFNGGRETPFAGEKRIIIESPKVATYDQKPEMAAREITDQLIVEIETRTHEAIIVNYANPDMVGHSGDLAATIRAVEVVDHCLGRLVEHAGNYPSSVYITADHGNAEMMIHRQSGKPHTAHTTNPVPLIALGANIAQNSKGIGDIAKGFLQNCNKIDVRQS